MLIEQISIYKNREDMPNKSVFSMYSFLQVYYFTATFVDNLYFEIALTGYATYP